MLAALLLNPPPDKAGDVDSIRRWQDTIRKREEWKKRQREDEEARRRHIEDAVARLRKVPEAAEKLAAVVPNEQVDARLLMRNQQVLLIIEALYVEYLEEEDILLLYMEMT